MSTRKKASADDAPLPALDALPPRALDHPTLHHTINAFATGTGKRALVTKFKLPAAYINAVIYHYLEKYDN